MTPDQVPAKHGAASTMVPGIVCGECLTKTMKGQIP
jgi:hypothetical protein